ncbi:MAG: redoxin domain-containing protein [Rubrobacter sp.]|nr:redoxin domain-containing protein [Rubrobacter sp.]
MARTKMPSVPEVGGEVPEFMLSSAQGGQLRLSLRLDRGPVVVFFYRGLWSEECVEWVKALAAKEGEINLAGASLIGIGTVEPQESREFARQTGLQSYILYDYARVATREYGLLEQDKEHGDFARPAAFLIKTGHEVVEAWVDERPPPEELLAKVTELTGLPKAEEEEEGEEEKPKKRPRRAAKDSGDASDEAAGDGTAAEGGEPKRLTREEREKRRAERKAARAKEGSEEGAENPPAEAPAETGEGEKPSAEERAASEPEETGGGEEKPSA